MGTIHFSFTQGRERVTAGSSATGGPFIANFTYQPRNTLHVHYVECSVNYITYHVAGVLWAITGSQPVMAILLDEEPLMIR